MILGWVEVGLGLRGEGVEGSAAGFFYRYFGDLCFGR